MKTMYPRMISEGDGIFTDLQSLQVPWRLLNIASALNYGYYSHSARKLVSPFVFDVSDAEETIEQHSFNIPALTQAQRTIIATTVYNIFIRKWEHLWDVYTLEYNPIHDYNLAETETIEGSEAGTTLRTGTDTHNIVKSETNGGTETHAIDREIRNTGTDTTVVDGEKHDTGTLANVRYKDTTDTGTIGLSESTSIDRGIYGFNSSTDVGSNTETSTHNSTETRNLSGTEDVTDTETHNLTETNDVTTTETKNLTNTEDVTDTHTRNLTHSASNSDTETRNLSDTMQGTSNSTRELYKSGNIGFNKPQEMLTAELDLWQWNFFKSVFDDIDSILTMAIY